MAASPVSQPDQSLPVNLPANTFAMELTDVRVNGLALKRWFTQQFLLREGMPVPVIFAGAQDAFSQFNRLWRAPDNPYSYLREMSEYAGLEPAPMRVPLIGIDWKRLRYRPEQSYGSRVNRRVYYPTVDSAQEGLTRNNLANVAQARYPTAWDFVYEINFWCDRPDTQAIFIRQVTRALKASAGVPQTFIPVVYPGYFGAIVERLLLQDSIEDLTEKEPVDSPVIFRTAFTVVIEGYAVDQDMSIAPTVWNMVAGNGYAVAPSALSQYFDFAGVPTTFSLRTGTLVNSVLAGRASSLPPGPPLFADGT